MDHLGYKLTKAEPVATPQPRHLQFEMLSKSLEWDGVVYALHLVRSFWSSEGDGYFNSAKLKDGKAVFQDLSVRLGWEVNGGGDVCEEGYGYFATPSVLTVAPNSDGFTAAMTDADKAALVELVDAAYSEWADGCKVNL